MEVSQEVCEAKHKPIGDSLEHIRAAIDKIESRQWLVIMAICGSLAMTLLNIILGVKA